MKTALALQLAHLTFHIGVVDANSNDEHEGIINRAERMSSDPKQDPNEVKLFFDTYPGIIKGQTMQVQGLRKELLKNRDEYLEDQRSRSEEFDEELIVYYETLDSNLGAVEDLLSAVAEALEVFKPTT